MIYCVASLLSAPERIATHIAPRPTSVVAVFTIPGAIGNGADAATVGNSKVLDTTMSQQLEGWLGQGPVNLTNISTRTSSDNSVTFHVAVEGNGATLRVIEVPGIRDGTFSTPTLIGGYNPQSWDITSLHKLALSRGIGLRFCTICPTEPFSRKRRMRTVSI